MRTNDFTAPITSKQLNESMFKKFGVKVNFEKYDREQLENYRNLLRTKLHQTELSSNFNALLSNESYQKDKHMMELLNARIKEMLGESKRIDERAVSQKQQQAAGAALAAKRKGTTKGLKGASKEMSKMSTKELEKFAGTKHKGLPKKVKEGKAHAYEMAHRYAMEYAKAVREGNLDYAIEMRDACESWGGKISHGAMGEAFHTHMGINNGKAYKCDEGALGAIGGSLAGGAVGKAAGAGLGAMVGGPVGAAIGGVAGDVAGTALGATAGDKMTGESVKEGKKAKKDYDGDGKVETGKDEYMGARDKAIKKAMGKKTTEGLKGGQKKLDVDKDGKIEKTDLAKLRASKDKKMKKVKEGITESIARFIAEDEEGKAKSITAGLDMVNDFTSWMQRIATYQTKSMIELSDQIRAHFGDAEAQRFKEETYAALEASLNALTQSREQLSNSVAVLAGEAPAEEPMGAEPGMDADMGGDAGAELSGVEDMPPAEDEFAAADAAAGGPETTGRIKRESIERGNRLMKILGA